MYITYYNLLLFNGCIYFNENQYRKKKKMKNCTKYINQSSSLTCTLFYVTIFWVSIYTITWLSVPYRSRIITQSCSFLHSSSTSYWAWSINTPWSPVSIDLYKITMIFLRCINKLNLLLPKIFLAYFNTCSLSTCSKMVLTIM